MSKPKKSNTMFPRDDENVANPKTYPIESPAEIPRIRRRRESSYPFDKLKPAVIMENGVLVGPFFRIPVKDKKKVARAAYYAGRATNRKFATRDLDADWVGVWRLK